jgi:hypothetical protein
VSIAAEDHTSAAGLKNRYQNVRRYPDFTIDQDWTAYSPAEHDRWDRLYARSQAVLRDRACKEFLAALDRLKLSEPGIPDMACLSITNFFPTSIRGTGVGWSQVAGRPGSLIGPLVGGALVAQGMAPNQLFQISSIAPLLACVSLLVFAKISMRGAA